MPDVTDRDGKEAKIIKVLAREFNRARMQLVGLIPELDEWMMDVAPEFWADHRSKLIGGLAPQLTSVFLEQAQTMLDEFPAIGVEWGLVNEGAATWAKDYSFSLVNDLTMTSKRTLQKLIPQFFEQQWTQGQLRDALTPTFGDTRAKTIARTEVTRAASEGEQETARQLEREGIRMQPIWLTRADEIVCPICLPRNGKKIGVDIPDEYPPGHPNCRCSVGYTYLD